MGLCLLWPFARHTDKHALSLDEQSREHLYASNRLMAQKRYQQADAELHRLLKLLADSASANKLTQLEYTGRRARVFAELANLRLLMGDAVSAEGLLVQTMRDAVAGGVPTRDEMIVELSLKLALIYVKLGHKDKAKSGFEFCVASQRTNVDDSADKEDNFKSNSIALLGMVYNSYSQ